MDASRKVPDPRAEQELRARVSEWWTARQYRDQRTMYGLYEPAYRRRVSLEDFRAQSTVRDRFDILSHEVVDVVFEDPRRASVMVKYVTILPQVGGPVSSRILETWMREGDRWFKAYQTPQPPFPPARPSPSPRGDVPPPPPAPR